MWLDMFGMGVPVVEKMLRPVLVYVFLVVGLRLAGKRELAQLNPFDLVVLLTISNAVQNAIIGNDLSVTGGIIGGATLLLVNHFVVRILYGHKRLDRLVEGEPDTLVEGGRVRMDRLKKEMVTLAELEAGARKQGFASLATVERAVLEPGGGITFVGHHSRPEAARHQEVLERLDHMMKEIADLKAGFPALKPAAGSLDPGGVA
ncbi:MAG: DUF421 domain-containing protein [Acidobacteria bacterium]|nr:DUF421 domain-containing protein [Planctomycetota bacterium]MBE3132853.1 DUF421 domain-containing protein [Acidobacteriota bacterium]